MAETLEQRPFAATGKSVSVLGLGTVKFGRNTQVKYPGGGGFPLPSDSEIEAILDLCIEKGVTLLDTAPAYGTAEERLGKILGARRDDFFLVTKTGEEFDGEKSQYIFTAAHTQMSVERSLKRLKTDVLDCVLVHASRDDVDVIKNTDVLATLSRLKGEGKIRSFGVSANTIAGGKRAADLCDAVMVSYNRDYTAELEVINYAAAKSCAVLVKKGFASGHAQDVEGSIRFITETKGVTSLVFGSRSLANISANINTLLTA
jgi:aryl-alcohol dehydrogenase-like predicted oxidoreductase